MEVYILDSLSRRETVVDRFESLIWTERFKRYGDFELTLHSTLQNRNLFIVGTKITHNESLRVMTVESVEDTIDTEGKTTLTVKGRSLESVLDNRLARGSMADLTTDPKWIITGLPAAIARKIFHDICVVGTLDPADIIPNIVEGSIYPVDTIGEPSTSITYEIDPQTVYAALVTLCDLYDMGFRMVLDPTTLQVYFDIYMGSDRTTKQTTLPAVVFSPTMENLQNTTEFTTIVDYKNTAYVLSPVGTEIVYASGIDPNVTGFERKILIVKADDIKDEDPVIASTKMIQRGNEELSKHRLYSGFDGELNPNSIYKPGRDYNLGDLVEYQNPNGFATDMQVTEQIWTSDKEGDRTYPTLSINQFITPGSWLSWDFNQVWEDLTTEHWADLP